MVAAGTSADGSAVVVPDAAARMPGRGAWVHRDSACLDLALRRQALTRALRTSGTIAPESVREISQHLGTTGSTSTTSTAPPPSGPTESEAGQHQMGTR